MLAVVADGATQPTDHLLVGLTEEAEGVVVHWAGLWGGVCLAYNNCLLIEPNQLCGALH